MAEREEPGGSALLGPRGQERRLGIALLEVLVDHGGLRQHPAIRLEDGHLADRIELVQPGRAVGKVDHDRLVVDALLGERDPNTRAVRAPWRVDRGGAPPSAVDPRREIVRGSVAPAVVGAGEAERGRETGQ